MQISIKTNHCLWLSVLGLGCFLNLGNANHVLAETVETAGEEAIAQTNDAKPRRREKPTFYERDQDPGARGSGFSGTFVIDAVGGSANPLSGSGGSSTTVDSLQKAEFNTGGSERPPVFNRTNVIIPPGVTIP
ncbi:hypothetical protein [Okeania sp.]|uniref:hypothetical protein n=1 Tax=Okeania sp. TaxID=3100323 RepID=UPI002B4B064D|nr:hypothetical protein [Okeania sp.]MEB3343669.1 hypothetical protein [Okeania sp.]